MSDQYYVAYDQGDLNDNIDFPDGTGPSCGPGETLVIQIVPQIYSVGAPLPETVLLTLEVYGNNGGIENIQARAIPPNEVQTR